MGLALRTWWRFVAGWALNGKYLAPYVPTSDYIVSEILKLAALTHTDRLFDVGCGDGRTRCTPTHSFISLHPHAHTNATHACCIACACAVCAAQGCAWRRRGGIRRGAWAWSWTTRW
jgi:hypothetical protein